MNNINIEFVWKEFISSHSKRIRNSHFGDDGWSQSQCCHEVALTLSVFNPSIAKLMHGVAFIFGLAAFIRYTYTRYHIDLLHILYLCIQVYLQYYYPDSLRGP